MSKYEDLTGKIIGNLFVLGRDKNNKSRNSYWKCECLCEDKTKMSVSRCNLKHRKCDCGCQDRKKLSESLINKKINKLLILHSYDNYRKLMCLCDCGKLIMIKTDDFNQKRVYKRKYCKCHDFLDISGWQFGYLTAIIRNFSERHCSWICSCSCGNIKTIQAGHLHGKYIVSCGCQTKIIKIKKKTTHGQSKSKIYKTWLGIRNRCSEINEHYSLRGITICEEWKNDFTQFYSFVKELQNFNIKGMTLDRIDNNGNYEPGNVRWATAEEQAQNKRNNVINMEIAKQIKFLSKTKKCSEIAKIFNIKPINVGNIIRGYTWKNA